MTDIVEGELNAVVSDVQSGKLLNPGPPAKGARARGGGATPGGPAGAAAPRAGGRARRYAADVAAMQRDSATYCDEPADAEAFAQWRAEAFSLEAAEPEISVLVAANALVAELQARLVPLLVEREDFWARYFYRWAGGAPQLMGLLCTPSVGPRPAACHSIPLLWGLQAWLGRCGVLSWESVLFCATRVPPCPAPTGCTSCSSARSSGSRRWSRRG
jgi:hypothetical protein